MNRHDLDAFMSVWGSNPTFEFPGGSILGGTYRGRDQIRAWLERWWDRFPTTAFTLGSVSVEDIRP